MTADEPVEVVTRPPSALAWARALTDTQITQEQLDELVRIRLSEPSAAALRDTGLHGGQEAVERVRAVTEAEVLRQAIDAAHHERSQATTDGRDQETLTLFQHWSATAGWMASRLRAVERGDEPDWPDAMNSAALGERP